MESLMRELLFTKSIRGMGYPTSVVAQVSVPGFHRWENAPEKVKFLRNYHRHLFVIESLVYIEKDRQVEFFMLQEKVKKLIALYIENQEEETKNFDWNEFQELTGINEEVLVINSCEDFATWLVGKLEQTYGTECSIMVSVSEDNENKSIVSNF